MKVTGDRFSGVTFSIGVVQVHEGKSGESVIKRADYATDHAKRKGGDCVMIAAKAPDRKG